jgi:hypothetical protein
MKRLLTATAVVALALSVGPPAQAAAESTPHARSTYDGTVLAALGSLKVRREHRAGYDRDLFPLWDSQGGNCSTRDVVLIDESTDPDTAPDSNCDYTGSWRSAYDGVTTTDPSTFDIDHRVPLAEAWDSGAWRWTTGTRERYANDLGDPRPLIAVSASSNRSKGDSEPQDWMPAKRQCTYLVQWVVVKVRWHLAVNRPEKRFIRSDLARLHCGDPPITVHRAPVRLAP